jgi:hypothetical protein
VHGEAVHDRASLARAPRAVRVFDDAGRAGLVTSGIESPVQPNEFFVRPGAQFDVGLDEQLPPWLEDARHAVEESVLNEEPLGVTLLPPRIREVYEYASHGRIRVEPWQRVARVLGEDPRTVAESLRAQATVHDRRPLAANLESQQCSARLGDSALDEKPSTSRPDLDFDPFATGQQGDLHAIGGKARCVFVRTIHGSLYRMGVAHDTAGGLTGPGTFGNGRAVIVESPTVPSSAASATRRHWQVWKWRALVYGPLSLALALLAQRTIGTVLDKVGHAGAALDDAYIHFQYARAIAEGHPLRFEAGEPRTSGSTSLLWPLVLAPFWALGARDEGILWPAWALSFAALGGVAWEASRLTERLAGRTAAIGAGAMTLGFGGFLWFAASGMEVLPFAWAIARATRRASEWSEAPAHERSPRNAAELLALAWTATLFRPEGAASALFVAATLGCFPRPRAWPTRLIALAAASSVAAAPVALWALTGSPESATAIAKLLPGNPYYPGPVLALVVEQNAKVLVDSLLDGEIWSAEFVPHHAAPFAIAGLGAVAVLGLRTGRRWRAAGVLLLALTMFAPCFYVTFLWNRLRYLWPFATGWIVGIACLARVAGDIGATVRLRGAVTGILSGIFVGLLASKVEGVIDDVAQSASAIDRQQVALGRWAKEHLPIDARIGVNDTGAIAYFSERRTFDIVGLTTRDEARYWVAGVGSRLEHYERMRAEAPSQLPTYFIVYPQWMATSLCFGELMHEATVMDSTILGGQTMQVYPADWSRLGSGERPWTATGGGIVDALDVADLESERQHEYDLAGARDGQQVAREGLSPDGTGVVDGGRTMRTLERFIASLPTGVDILGIARLEGPPDSAVHITANGRPVGQFRLSATEDGWVERTFAIPAGESGPRTRIELRTNGSPITVFHYWFTRRHP